MSCTTADISFTVTLRDLGLIPGVLCGPEPYTIPPSNSNLFDSLPPSVTVSQSLQTFSKRLKTELFQRSYTTASLLISSCAERFLHLWLCIPVQSAILSSLQDINKRHKMYSWYVRMCDGCVYQSVYGTSGNSPSPPLNNIRVMVIVRMLRGNIIRITLELCAGLCDTKCSQSAAHLYEQFLQVKQVGFVTLGPLRCV